MKESRRGSGSVLLPGRSSGSHGGRQVRGFLSFNSGASSMAASICTERSSSSTRRENCCVLSSSGPCPGRSLPTAGASDTVSLVVSSQLRDPRPGQGRQPRSTSALKSSTPGREKDEHRVRSCLGLLIRYRYVAPGISLTKGAVVVPQPLPCLGFYLDSHLFVCRRRPRSVASQLQIRRQPGRNRRRTAHFGLSWGSTPSSRRHHPTPLPPRWGLSLPGHTSNRPRLRRSTAPQ